MKADIIKNTTDLIESLIKENQETKERLQQQLKAAEAQRDHAEVAIKDAVQSVDIEQHHKLHDEYRRVCDDIELYRAKLESLDHDPMMTSEDYKKALDEITTYRRNRILNLRKRVAAHFKDIQEMYDKELAVYNEIGSLLSKLRTVIMRDNSINVDTLDPALSDLMFLLSRAAAKRFYED